MKTFLNKYSFKANHFYKMGRYFGGNVVDSAVPKGIQLKSAPKIKDLLIWVNVVGMEGSIRRVPGWPNEPLNATLNRHFTSGFHSECNGGDAYRKYSDDAVAETSATGPSCGKCHVVISDPWFTYMKPKVHPVEMHTLESTNTNVYPTSRLACCIALKPWMNEMICRVEYDSNLHYMEEDYDDDSADSGIGGANQSRVYPA